MEYIESVAKTGIGLLNADQHEKGKVFLCHWETPGTLTVATVQFGSIIPCQHLGKPFTEQFKKLMPIVKISTSLDNRTASIDKVFKRDHTLSNLVNFFKWSKTKTKIYINDIEDEGLVYIDVYVAIILPKSWHTVWHLQDVNIQHLVIATLFQIKQSVRWVECIEPEI